MELSDLELEDIDFDDDNVEINVTEDKPSHGMKCHRHRACSECWGSIISNSNTTSSIATIVLVVLLVILQCYCTF